MIEIEFSFPTPSLFEVSGEGRNSRLKREIDHMQLEKFQREIYLIKQDGTIEIRVNTVCSSAFE